MYENEVTAFNVKIITFLEVILGFIYSGFEISVSEIHPVTPIEWR